MERVSLPPRPEWQQSVENLGMSWHTQDGAPYWDESAFWTITLDEANILQNAAREGYEMLLDTIEHVIETGKLIAMGYDAETEQIIRQSWENSDHEPAFWGRFDFAFDGIQPKIMEFNGDFPGSSFETAAVQRAWAADLFPEKQQFNVLTEQLISTFQWMAQTDQNMSVLHVTGLAGDPESEGTAGFLANLAEQAGLNVVLLGLHEIGYLEQGGEGYFVDLNEQRITNLLKLRPTEWMLEGGDLGPKMKRALLSGALRLIDPPWKMLASDKRILAEMWNRYAYHPLLLNTSTTPLFGMAAGQVIKPIGGYEGQNVVIEDVAGAIVESTQGAYGEMPCIYQERAFLAQQDGNHAVFGVWVCGGDGVALSIRESEHLITDANARFVPHIIE